MSKRRNKSRKQLTRTRNGRQMQLEPLEAREMLTTTFMVTNLDDVDPNAPVPGSLRQAIFDSNGTPGTDEIIINVNGTISLSRYLAISDNVTITGPGATNLAVSGGNSQGLFRINDFNAANFLNVELAGLTLTEGNDFFGTAIISSENVTLRDVHLSNNTPAASAMRSIGGTLTIENSRISGNTSSGASIYSRDGAVTIDSSMFDGNINTRTNGPGAGALDNQSGTLTIRDSTFSGNTGRRGGGVFSDPGAGKTTTIQRTTFSGNTAVDGGGLHVKTKSGGTTTIEDSTFSGNMAIRSGGANYGGGLYSRNDGGTVTIQTTESSTNTANAGGGVYARTEVGGMTTIQNSTVSGNTGNGIHGKTRDSTLAIQNSEISDNLRNAVGGGYGGGMWARAYNGSTVNVENSTITGNQAEGTGGGIFLGLYSSTIAVKDSTISGNTSARRGGGIAIFSLFGGVSSSTIQANSFDSNLSTGTQGGDGGGGLFVVARNNGTTTIEDNTFNENTSVLNGGGLFATIGGFGFTDTGVIHNNAFTDNTAGNNGGGLFVGTGGNVTIEESTVTGNTSNSSLASLFITRSGGGGIFLTSDNGATASLDNNTVSGNTANSNASGFGGLGGGLLSAGTTTIQNSTLSGNTASSKGGGIYSFVRTAALSIENSTLSGNTGGDGGGAYIVTWTDATTSIDTSTITANTASGKGGGVFSYAFGLVSVGGTIVGGNTATVEGPDLFNSSAAISSDGYNLVGDGTDANWTPAVGDQVGTITTGLPINPQLGPLQNNGGTTETHSLLAASSAINAGDPAAVAGVGDVPLYDQRGSGFDRVLDGRIDVGAFEVSNSPPTDILLSVAAVGENVAIGTVIGTLSAVDPNAGDTATFSEVLDIDGKFAVVGNQLLVDGALNFENQASHDVTLRVTDSGGESFDRQFAITVTDVNEAPSVALTNTTSSLVENIDTSSRIKVADIEVTDDALGTNVLSLSGVDAVMFEIDDDELFLKAGSTADFETNPILDVAVNVDDMTVGATPDDVAALAIAVTDIDPVDNSSAVMGAVQVLEDAGVLSNGEANPTLNFLDQAIKDYNKGKIAHAVEKLEQGRDEIQDLIDDGDLDPLLGDPLIDDINDIITEILSGSA